MEDIRYLWSYHENIDELKHKLLYTTLELDALRMEANEEMIKNEEHVKNLENLLKIAYQERDEAKTQLQKLLNKLMPELLTSTESNSLTDTNNNNHHNSHGSSPTDSFIDAVSSPELSAISMPDSYNNGTQRIDHDQGSVWINNLTNGKALPKKGKLLQAVMEAGPLLQTLLVAGPLPRWRNPPPLQHFKIPPVLIGGCDSAAMNQKQPENPINNVVQRPVNSSPYVEMSCGSSQMILSPMFNFAGGPSGSFLSDRRLSSVIGKRQRLH